MEFISELKEDIISALKTPSETANRIKTKADYTYGLKVLIAVFVVTYLLNGVFSIIGGILSSLAFLAQGTEYFIAYLIGFAIGFIVFYIILFFFVLAFNIVYQFIYIGIIWGVGKLLGGKAAYSRFFGSLVLVISAVSIVSVIMVGILSLISSVIDASTLIIGPVSEIISMVFGLIFLAIIAVFLLLIIYYETIFTREVHEISTGKALISVLVPMILMIGLLVLIILVIIFILGFSLMSLQNQVSGYGMFPGF